MYKIINKENNLLLLNINIKYYINIFKRNKKEEKKKKEKN